MCTWIHVEVAICFTFLWDSENHEAFISSDDSDYRYPALSLAFGHIRLSYQESESREKENLRCVLYFPK